MSNNFSGFVKKSIITVLSRLIGLFLLVIIVTIIAFETSPFLVIVGFFVAIGIVFYVLEDKKRKKIVKYKLGLDVDNNIYIPLVLNNDYLKKVFGEFNNPIELSGDYKNLVSFVQYMIDNNQIIFIEKKYKLDNMVNTINNLMKNQKINYSIDKNDIINNDDEIIKLRRKDNIINDLHDLSMIRSILEKNHLELIRFYDLKDDFSKFARIEGYLLAVVPISKVETLKKYQVELVNNSNYR